MLQDIKNTLKQSAIYGLSRVSTKLVAFILLPLYSVNFTVAEYGVIGRLETFWQILWSIFLFGLESGVIRWFTLIPDEGKKKKFLFSTTVFLFVLNIFFVFIIFSTSGFFSTLIFETGEYTKLITFTSLIAALESVSFLVFLLIRIKEKPLMYSMFSILATLLNLGFQYYYIVFTPHKLEGVFLAKIFSPAIVVALLLPYYLKSLKIGFDKENLKALIIYSFPMMIASLVSSLLNQSDRYFLGYLSDQYSVGIFVLGNNIAGLINFFIISPFALAFTVISWKKLNDSNAGRFYTKTATYFYLVTVYSAVFLSLFTPYIIKIFTLNTSYWPAMNIVPWLSMAMPLYGIHFIAVFSYYVTKKTKFLLAIYTVSLITKIILNLLLIKPLAIYGAAIANYASFAVLVIVLYIYSRKEYFIIFEWFKILLMTVCAIALIIPFFYIRFDNKTLEIGAKFLVMIAYPFLLYLFRFYEKVEVESLKGFFRKYRSKFLG